MEKTYYREDLAFVHDKSYSSHAQYAAAHLLKMLRRRNIGTGAVIDLGCGSGILAQILSENSFEVTGVDYSPALIRLATERVPEARFKVGSIYEFEIPPCVAVSIIGEVLNYYVDEGDRLTRLEVLFQKTFDALKENGILLFDIVEPGLLGPEPVQKRIVETGEWTMFMDYGEDRQKNTLTRHITLFRKVGSLYRKSKEAHQLNLYRREEIVDMLKKIGYKVSLTNHYNGNKFRKGHIGFMAYV